MKIKFSGSPILLLSDDKVNQTNQKGKKKQKRQ